MMQLLFTRSYSVQYWEMILKGFIRTHSEIIGRPAHFYVIPEGKSQALYSPFKDQQEFIEYIEKFIDDPRGYRNLLDSLHACGNAYVKAAHRLGKDVAPLTNEMLIKRLEEYFQA